MREYTVRNQVLLIEPWRGAAPEVEWILRRKEYQVRAVEPGTGAVATAHVTGPDLILALVRAPGPSTLAMARTLSWVHQRPVIVLADRATYDFAREVAEIPYLYDVIRYPPPVVWFLDAVQEAIEANEARHLARV